jgi:hypothetical protein
MIDEVVRDNSMDFTTLQRYAMYADGVDVVDIASVMGEKPQTTYRHFGEFPRKHAEAKQKRIERRNAKYRRVGALAVDIQIGALERYRAVMAGDDEDAKAEIRARLKDISVIGESAERRADLNEGKVTERTEHGGRVQIVTFVDQEAKQKANSDSE